MFKLASFYCKSNPIVRAGLFIPKVNTLFDLDNKYVRDSLSLGSNPKSIDMQFLIEHIFSRNPKDFSSTVKKLINNSNNFMELGIPIDDDITIKAPIPLPRRNVMCVGKNYRDHVQEMKGKGTSITGNDDPQYPQFFSKLSHCVIGPNDKIESHDNLTQFLDYEVELAVIIGKSGRDIPRDKALDHVMGYTCANDVTARDLQKKHQQWFKGKSLDSSCPLGPYITLSHTCDPEMSTDIPHNLDIRLWVNNDLRQNSNTNKLIFNIPELIHHLSLGTTLLPGDVILTGTPSGVGFARQPPLMVWDN